MRGIRTMRWKALDTNPEYEVSDTGIVRKTHIQKQYKDRDGYKKVTITAKGITLHPSVHRLVLHTFSPCENEEQLEVHHKDGNPENNCLDNLQWVTHEENIGYISNDKKAPNQFIAQKVVQMDLEGRVITIFSSLKEAERLTGCNYRHIGEVCKGKRKTTGGYKWKYFEGSTTIRDAE